jgi:predicted acetyltransferase
MTKPDIDSYHELCRYCFESVPGSMKVYMKWVSRHLNHSWGAFESGELIAGLWYNLFSMRVGNDFLPMGGVAAVASAPEVRNRGIVRQLMLRAHRQMRREGGGLAGLQPFQHDFYARMGYGDVFFCLKAFFAPAQVAKRSPRGYRLRVIDGNKEWKLLEQLRQELIPYRFGTLRRDRAYWETEILYTLQGIRQTYLVEKGKSPMGYVVTDLGRDRKTNEFRVFVVDAVWRNQSAWDAILQLLRGHRDHINKIQWYLPVDVPLHDQMVDPLIDVKLMPKMMLKLVDFKVAVESRSYPDDLTVETVFDVAGDATSPWNTGRWLVSWQNGRARISKFRGRVSRKNLARADIGTLAILYSGRLSASELAAAGGLEAGKEVCALLNMAFPKTIPYISEWF